MNLLSIITVVKEFDSKLIQTLLSVKNQTHQNYNYYIIQKFDVEKTKKLLKELGLKNVKLIKSSDNSFYNGLNWFLKKEIIKTEYFFLLHSGDLLYNKNVLKKLNLEIKKNKFNIYSTKIYYYYLNKYKHEWFYNKPINKSYQIPHTGVIYKTSFAKNLLYDDTYKISADTKYLLELKYKKKESINFLNIDLIFMEKYGMSSNIRFFHKKVFEDLKIFYEFYKIFFIIYYLKKIFHKFFIYFIFYLFRSDNKKHYFNFNKNLFLFNEYLNQKPKKISVIVPIGKFDKNINLTVNSILKQTYKLIEIIIIDNYEIKRQKIYALTKLSKKIKYFYYNKKGVSYARNYALKKLDTNSTHVAFCDCDDIWSNDKLKLQIKQMTKKNSPISYTDYMTYKKDKNEKTFDHKRRLVYQIKSEKFIYNNPICTSSVVASKKIFDLINFKNYILRSDYNLWIKLYYVGIKFLKIKTNNKKPLVFYLKHKSSISSNKVYNLIFNYKVLKNYFSHFKSLYYLFIYVMFHCISDLIFKKWKYYE